MCGPKASSECLLVPFAIDLNSVEEIIGDFEIVASVESILLFSALIPPIA